MSEHRITITLMSCATLLAFAVSGCHARRFLRRAWRPRSCFVCIGAALVADPLAGCVRRRRLCVVGAASFRAQCHSNRRRHVCRAENQASMSKCGSIVLTVWLSVAVSSCTSHRSSSRAPGSTVDVRVCDLINQPQAFDGRYVRVRARYFTDAKEYVTLADVSGTCRGWLVPVEPKAGVFPKELANGACAVFAGKFKWDAAPLILGHSHVIYVENVSRVDVCERGSQDERSRRR